MLKAIAIFLSIGILVQFGVLIYIHTEFKSARQTVVNAQRDGCERIKLDRRDNADFQKAHSTYIGTITSAKSVKEDVKKAAGKAKAIFAITSTRLGIRARINCKEAYP